ncbi:unnamed protein product [Schistocephalus solidus]|uniref:Poly(ADP-ribose) glycohydrolase n=1 Tax=Schistocephalus solidus TaxID=70667 RepID=A0A183SUQ7_SCHSO|nr:unnamed protein product [Schistocephalus solidus]
MEEIVYASYGEKIKGGNSSITIRSFAVCICILRAGSTDSLLRPKMEGFSLCSFVNPYLSPDEPVAYMPHHSPRWPEIKVFLARIAATCRNIFHLVSLFDYLEHLVNLGPPSTALLQLIPSRETFVGLGNYLFYHTAEEQKNFFFSSLLPKILGYASEVENIFLTSPLTYSRAFEGMPCLLPVNVVFRIFRVNTQVAGGQFGRLLLPLSTVQVAKLQAILQYFACLSASEQQLLSSSSFRIRRRSLRLKPLNQPPMGAEAQPLLAFCGRQLVEALRGTHLPLALIDNTADKEIVSEMFDLPIIDFVNSYVGGGALRASELSPKSVYFRYPETLVALALCCRLEGPEALWIDNYLGPFGPSMSPLEATKPSTFRRLVVANSTRFPVWASELQYTEAGIIDEVVKTTAALFQVDLDDEEIAVCYDLPVCLLAKPLSDLFRLKETGDIPRLRLDCESFGGANLASTREARTIERFARHLSKVTLRDALQACIRCPAPLRPHHGHPSLPNFTVAASHRSLDRRPRYRQEGSPDAVFSFQNPANLPARKTPSRPFESNENLCDSSCGTSLGALLEGLPGKFTETVGLLTNEVMSEAIGSVRKRLRGIHEVSDTLTHSLLKECLTSSANLRNPASPRNIPRRHLRPLTVNTGNRDMQPQTLDVTQHLAEKPAVTTYFLIPSHTRAVNSRERKATYNERLMGSKPPPLARTARRPSGFVTGPLACGVDPQVNVMIQWISAAVASSSPSSSSLRQSKSASPVALSASAQLQKPPEEAVACRSRSYLSPVVFATNGNPQLQQLHTIVNAVGAAGWNADHLLRSLLEYSEYRSCVLSGGPSSPRMIATSHGDPAPSAPPPSSRVLSFFDFLLARFSDCTVRTLPI